MGQKCLTERFFPRKSVTQNSLEFTWGGENRLLNIRESVEKSKKKLTKYCLELVTLTEKEGKNIFHLIVRTFGPGKHLLPVFYKFLCCITEIRGIEYASSWKGNLLKVTLFEN